MDAAIPAGVTPCDQNYNSNEVDESGPGGGRPPIDVARELGVSVEDLYAFYYAGIPVKALPRDRHSIRHMAIYVRKRRTAPPMWMYVTGLWPTENCRGAERRRRLRHLYKHTVGLIRRELLQLENDPNKEERTIYWEPTAEVCGWLEIAPSKLSDLLKEFNGNSLSQTIDCVKVESVKKKMRADIREKVLGFKVAGVQGSKGKAGDEASRLEAGDPGGRLEAGGPREEAPGACLAVTKREDVIAVWRELRKERKWPDFSQNIWANHLGFSSYKRFYRACVATYHKTPYQIELEIIAELLDEKECVPDFHEYTLKEIEEEVLKYGALESVKEGTSGT